MLHLSQQKAVQYHGENIPEARISFSVEITSMIMFLHNLVVYQIAISLMLGFILWRGFIHCHMQLTRYIYTCICTCIILKCTVP